MVQRRPYTSKSPDQKQVQPRGLLAEDIASAQTQAPIVPGVYDFDAPNEIEVSARNAMIAASKRDPDRYARILNLADKKRLPHEYVAENFDRIKSEVDLESIDMAAVKSENPYLYAWLSNERNASIALDDLPALQRLEVLYGQVDKPKLGMIGYALKRAVLALIIWVHTMRSISFR